MSANASISLLTYVWHYLVARLIYDQLLRPLLGGRASGLLVIGCVAAAAFLVGRSRGRRSGLRASERGMSRRHP